MKIGVDIRTLMDKQYSGVPEYTLNVLRAILKKDCKNEYKFYYNSFEDIRMRIPDFDNDNVEIVRTSFPNKVFNYGMQKILRYPKLDKKLGVDLFFMPHMNFASFSSGCFKIITIHDLSFLRYPEFFSWKKNVWHSLISVKRTLREFDLIVAVSENTKRDIVELCKIDESRVVVVHSAVDKRFSLVENKGVLQAVKDKYLLADDFIFLLGTLEPRKNIESLVMAFDAFKSNYKGACDYELVIAGGDGWKNKEIYKVIERSKNKEKIKVLGYVDDFDKPALYSLARVLVYPSFYEGFGFPPLEAMACGTPVLVGGVSSLPEIVGSAGVMIDPYNYGEVSLALLEVLGNDDIYVDLSKVVLGRASIFSWDSCAEKYLELFKRF